MALGAEDIKAAETNDLCGRLAMFVRCQRRDAREDAPRLAASPEVTQYVGPKDRRIGALRPCGAIATGQRGSDVSFRGLSRTLAAADQRGHALRLRRGL